MASIAVQYNTDGQPYVLGVRFPMFQPQFLKTCTTLGVTAAVSGTRMKIKLL